MNSIGKYWKSSSDTIFDNDTVYPDEIYSRISEKDTFYYADDAFLKKTINARLSFFSGLKEEIVWEDVGNNLNYVHFQYEKKREPVLYYSFDNIEFTKYRSLGLNRQLVDKIKENTKAYNYYRSYRFTEISGIISSTAFVIPLITGLVKHNDFDRVKPYIFTSVSGMLASIFITVGIPKRLFNKAIVSYNSDYADPR